MQAVSRSANCSRKTNVVFACIALWDNKYIRQVIYGTRISVTAGNEQVQCANAFIQLHFDLTKFWIPKAFAALKLCAACYREYRGALLVPQLM